jgi:cell wall-associated NlpC family hydrolase
MKIEDDSGEKLLVVRAPVANLRRKPVEPRTDYAHDELQETQLLYNEALLYKGEEAGWYYVEGTEQTKFSTERGWHGYPGWVKKESVLHVTKAPPSNSVVTARRAQLLSEPREGAPSGFFLSFGTRLQIEEAAGEYLRVSTVDGSSAWIQRADVVTQGEIPNDPFRLRQAIVKAARLFAGTPYLWGGRSMFMADLTATVTGVDCSGFTNLVYRGSKIDLPRNAHDQWLSADKISPGLLRPADLVFVSKASRHSSIDHVMLYVGEERVIEAFESGTRVKEKTFKEKLGSALAPLERKSFIVDGRHIYFGSVKELDRPE